MGSLVLTFEQERPSECCCLCECGCQQMRVTQFAANIAVIDNKLEKCEIRKNLFQKTNFSILVIKSYGHENSITNYMT